MLKKIFFLVSLFLLAAFSVFAIQPAETEWGIQYKMNPKNPAPGDYVFLDIYSYSIDLDASNISYILNGKLEQGGTGNKKFNFKIPKNNKTQVLNITATDFYGKVERLNINIKPVSMDLVYEVVDPYRPKFYKGKSVAISQSKLKFFAFPSFVNSQGKNLDPKSLVYTWKVNGDIVSYASGIGKDSFLLEKAYGVPRETKVFVEARSLDRTMIASKGIIIEPDFTEIDFYIDDKITPFDFKTASKSRLVSDYLNSDIVAVPYFFNDLNISDIQWTINGSKINLLSGGDDLRMNIIRNENNVSSLLNLKLRVESDSRPLQSANEKFKFTSTQKLIEANQKELIRKSEIERVESDSGFFGL